MAAAIWWRQCPGSSSKLFHDISSLYLKLSNEGTALINHIEVTTSCGEEYQSDWLSSDYSPVPCTGSARSQVAMGGIVTWPGKSGPGTWGNYLHTINTQTQRAESCSGQRAESCSGECAECAESAGLRLIIREYEISSGTSLITSATIKHRHLFMSMPLIHLHLSRNVMNQAAVIKVSKCPVSPQSHGSSLSQSTQAMLLKTNIIMLSFLQLIFPLLPPLHCNASPAHSSELITSLM